MSKKPAAAADKKLDTVQLGRIVHYIEGPVEGDADPCRAAVVAANWDKKGTASGTADLLVFDPTGVKEHRRVPREVGGAHNTWHWPAECDCCGKDAAK